MFTNCVFEFKDTNVGETTPTNDTHTGSYDLSPSIRKKLRVDVNNQLINGVDATGIYFDASNDRLGIGTSSPGHLLEVAGGGSNGEIVVNRNSGAEILLQAQSATGVIGTNTNHDLAIKTNGSTRMHIENGGNVGINDTSPSYKLDVNGTGRFTGALTGNATVVSDGAGDGVVTMGETDGVFIQEFHKSDSETVTDALYSNVNQRMAAVITRGNRVTTSGSGEGPSAQEVNGKIYLFNVVMENLSGSNVSDVFQSFDVTIFVSSSATHTLGTYRRTIKCLYDASNNNLIYQYVDTMQTNSMLNKIDVEVEYATGDATIAGVATDNIAVARFYIDLATLTGSDKWNANQIDWSWEFTGLKDEAISG